METSRQLAGTSVEDASGESQPGQINEAIGATSDMATRLRWRPRSRPR